MFIYYLTKFKWVVTGIAALVATMLTIVSYYEARGYNKAVAEFQAATSVQVKEATDKALLKASKETQEALNKQQLVFEYELTRAKEEKVVEVQYKKVVEYVDKVKIRDVCSIVDVSVISLLNESVNNSNVSSN